MSETVISSSVKVAFSYTLPFSPNRDALARLVSPPATRSIRTAQRDRFCLFAAATLCIQSRPAYVK
jgi:hypothetical protein